MLLFLESCVYSANPECICVNLRPGNADNTGEIGWFTTQGLANRGVTTALSPHIDHWIIETSKAFGFKDIDATIREDNTASQILADKLGFEYYKQIHLDGFPHKVLKRHQQTS